MEEEWDPETLVETLTWDQLKNFLAKEIIKAIKLACNNYVENLQKPSQDEMEKRDYNHDQVGLEESLTKVGEERREIPEIQPNLMEFEGKKINSSMKYSKKKLVKCVPRPETKKNTSDKKEKRKEKRKRKRQDLIKNSTTKTKLKTDRWQKAGMVLGKEGHEYKSLRHLKETQKKKLLNSEKKAVNSFRSRWNQHKVLKKLCFGFDGYTQD
ncbi:UNVERIFIED_CONTAM: hypothetical protein K2H54_048775 [Gekko kuhli]